MTQTTKRGTAAAPDVDSAKEGIFALTRDLTALMEKQSGRRLSTVDLDSANDWHVPDLATR